MKQVLNGMFEVVLGCNNCGGTGEILKNKCSSCYGKYVLCCAWSLLACRGGEGRCGEGRGKTDLWCTRVVARPRPRPRRPWKCRRG